MHFHSWSAFRLSPVRWPPVPGFQCWSRKLLKRAIFFCSGRPSEKKEGERGRGATKEKVHYHNNGVHSGWFVGLGWDGYEKEEEEDGQRDYKLWVCFWGRGESRAMLWKMQIMTNWCRCCWSSATDDEGTFFLPLDIATFEWVCFGVAPGIYWDWQGNQNQIWLQQIFWLPSVT